VTELLPFVLLLFAAGLAGGLLAGLLGIGGGILIVPALDLVLGYQGVDGSIRMQVAVATSLATIIPTSIASARAHARRHSVDFELVQRWGVYIFMGALLGAFAASQVHSDVLSAVFGVLALLIAANMLIPATTGALSQSVPRGMAANFIPTGVGFFSAMMGIGGGTFNVAVMTLCNQPIHRAIGTASLFGLLISIPGTLGFVIAGYGVEILPRGSFGFVNWIGFLLIIPGTVLAAPWGAKIAHALDKKRLSQVFALFLIIVAVRMIYRALQ
jgi:uncharacterized membrane protein YfcA